MIDFFGYKVPVFDGVNDNPIAPTNEQGGNGSDLIKRFNDLCDLLGNELNNNGIVESRKWSFVEQNFTAEVNQRYLVKAGDGDLRITLPSNPELGDSFLLFIPFTYPRTIYVNNKSGVFGAIQPANFSKKIIEFIFVESADSLWNIVEIGNSVLDGWIATCGIDVVNIWVQPS